MFGDDLKIIGDPFGYYELFESKNENNEDNAEETFEDRLKFHVVGFEAKETLYQPFSEKKVSKVFKNLNKNIHYGVSFDEEQFFQDRNSFCTEKLKDGLCTAMALSSLKYMFENRSLGSDASNFEKGAEVFKSGAPHEISLIQKVFNTIKLSEDVRGQDTRFLKMEAMANYFGLHLKNPSEVIQIVERIEDEKPVFNHNFYKQLQDRVAQLSEGPYVIRLLWNLAKSDPKKEEHVGHTIILLKGPEKSLVFDSGFAFVETKNQELAKTLKDAIQHWEGRDEVRFYQVEVLN